MKFGDKILDKDGYAWRVIHANRQGLLVCREDYWPSEERLKDGGELPYGYHTQQDWRIWEDARQYDAVLEARIEERRRKFYRDHEKAGKKIKERWEKERARLEAQLAPIHFEED